MGALNVAGEPSYQSAVCRCYAYQQYERDAYVALTNQNEKEDGNDEKLKIHQAKGSRAKKLFKNAIARYYHLSEVMGEELHESLEITANRLSDTFAFIKPLLALIQWSIDTSDLVTEFKWSQLAKTFVSTLLLGGSAFASIVVLLGSEVLLKPAMMIQLLFSSVLLVRSCIGLFQARKEKMNNKEELRENTQTLADLARTLNGFHTFKAMKEQIALFEKKIGTAKDPSVYEENRDYWKRKMAIWYPEQPESKVIQKEYFATQEGNQKYIQQYNEEKIEKDRYAQAKQDFTQALHNRLDLEKKRDQLKTEYHHAVTNIMIGLNNILASAVSFFFIVGVGLGIAGGSAIASIADMQYMKKQRKNEREKMDGNPELSKEENLAAYYEARLDESLKPTKTSAWKRFLSLGSRRDDVSKNDADEIRNAMEKTSFTQEQVVEATEKNETEKQIADYYVFWNPTEPTQGLGKMLGNKVGNAVTYLTGGEVEDPTFVKPESWKKRMQDQEGPGPGR